MIVNEWDASFTGKYGHDFPRNYMSFDTEFTGSNEREDLIVEIGHTIVENGLLVDQLNIVLNWYDYPGIKPEWLDYKLNNMRAIVGNGWLLTPDYVKKHGIKPLKALKFYHDLFQSWADRDLFFVAQNGMSADERLLRGNFNRFLNKPFELPANRYFDTGALFKATQIWEAHLGDALNYKAAMMPHRTETLKSYFSRIIGLRVSGVKWSLSLILDYYGLLQKHNIRETQLHSAGFDALCLHWIMEEYRSRIVRNNFDDNSLSAAALQRAFEQDMAKDKLAKEAAAKEKEQRKKENPNKFEDPPNPGVFKRTKPGLPQSGRRRRQRSV